METGMKTEAVKVRGRSSLLADLFALVRSMGWCRVTLRYLILSGRKILMEATQRMLLQALE